MGKRNQNLLAAVFLCWIGVVAHAYAKGFLFPGARENIVVDELALALLVVLVCLHCGNLILKFFRAGDLPPLEEALFSLALGVGLLSMATFVLGVMQCFYSWAAALLLAAFFLLGAGNYRYGTQLWLALRIWRPAFSLFECIGIIAIAGFVVITLVNCLTPPIARDALIHHLAIPKWYLRHHGIVDIPFSPPSYYPPFMQMLYSLCLLLDSDILAQLFHFVFYVGSLLFAFVVARRALSRAMTILAVLLFGSLPVVSQVSATPYADMGLTFFTLATFQAFCRWSENFSDRWLSLGALMTAWAVACKYNGFIVAFCFLAAIMVLLSRRRATLSTLGTRVMVFLLIIVSINLGWLGKNLWFTGNPVYPLANEYVGRPWLPDQPKFSGYQARQALYGEDLTDQLLLPWNLSVRTRSDARYELDGVANPIFLILLPFLALFSNPPPAVRGAIVFCLVYFLFFWASANVRLRYLMPLYPLLALMSAYVIAGLEGRIKRLLVCFTIALALLLNVYWILVYTSHLRPFEFLVGKESRRDFLCRHIPCYPVFEYINMRLAPDACVMFLYGGKHGNDGYYLDRDYFYDFVYLGYTGKRIIEEAGVPEDIRKKLRSLGITHLLVNWDLLKIDFASLSKDKTLIFERFCQEFLLPEFQKGGSCLYRVS